MPPASRHPRPAPEGRRPPSTAAPTPQKQAGRPKGVPSTIVNLRIPVDLLADLDRYIDRLEGQRLPKFDSSGSLQCPVFSVLGFDFAMAIRPL